MDNVRDVSDFQSPAWKREIEHSARMQKQRAEREKQKPVNRNNFISVYFPLNKHQYSKEL